MSEITVKPITGKRLPWAVEAKKLLFKDLPFHEWEQKQRELRKKIKI